MLALMTCYSLLLSGGVDSSYHHRGYLYDNLERKDAEEIVANLTEEICGEKPQHIHSNCRNILKHASHTRVCAVETNHGYFFVTKDLLDGVNVIFNRWD